MGYLLSFALFVQSEEGVGVGNNILSLIVNKDRMIDRKYAIMKSLNSLPDHLESFQSANFSTIAKKTAKTLDIS